MKNRKIWIFALAVILLCAAVGSVSAFMIKRATNPTTPTFQPAEVKCDVSVSYTGGKGENYVATVKVTNTSDVAAYLRVRLAITWVDKDGNQYYKPNAISVGENSDWIVENNVCYYCLVVASRETVELTLPLGDGKLSLTYVDDSGTLQKTEVTATPSVTAVAEAVQADPVDAVEDVWNVEVDADGKITGFMETTGTTETTTGTTTGEETEEN